MSACCLSAVRWFVVFVAGAAICAAPSPARAQSASDDVTVATLEQALRPGDRLTVTLPEDTTVKGKFVQLSPEWLTVQTPEGRRDLAIKDITRVQRTRVTVLTGLVIGALGGTAMMALASRSDAEIDAQDWLASIGGGAAIGLAWDALHNAPRTVYERGRRITFTPLVAPKAVGGAVRMTF